MDSPWYLLLTWLNILALLAIVLTSLKSRRALQFLCASIIAVNMLCVYWWFISEKLGFAWVEVGLLKMPVWLYIGVGVFVALFVNPHSGEQKLWRLVICTIVGGTYAFSKSIAGGVAILTNTGVPMERMIYMVAFVGALQVPFFGTLPMIAVKETSIAQTLLPKFSHFRSNARSLLMGTSVLVFCLVLKSLIEYGTVLRLNQVHFDLLALSKVAFIFLFFVLINQYVSMVLPQRLLDHIFPGESSGNLEILLFAVLFAALHYDYPLIDLFFSFFFGLAYGLIFSKTRTIAYGVILQMLMIVFTL